MSTGAKEVKRWSVRRQLTMRPAQRVQRAWRALLWLLPNLSISRAEVVAEMCRDLADDLGASSCTDIVDQQGKGFRLVGTLEQPLRFNNLGFDDNMVGLSPGAQNVCMLAAFGNGGVVAPNCVPIIGTQADEFNGNPEQHYFGMEGFDCGYNFMPFAVGSTINWNFPLGSSCISDADLDLGLTSIYCHFDMSCDLGTTKTTTAPATSTLVTSTVTSFAATSLTATSLTATSLTATSLTATSLTATFSSTLTLTTLTTTETSTRLTTTVSVSTTEALPTTCDELPRIPNSQGLAGCLGTASGAFCNVTCAEGFTAAEDILLCSDGLWQTRGECVMEGAAVTTESAAQVILRMNLTVESGESSSLEWAQQNKDALHVAFANSLDAHPSEIRVDLFPATGRRLLAQMTFDVRITWLLGEPGASNTSDRTTEAAEELAMLADAEGMTRFGEALQNELNGTDSRLASVSAEALSTEVIDSYVVPEASWILGPWDASACHCGGDAMEVAEVNCSGGSWLLCSGVDPPLSERPCRQCAEEADALALAPWILPVALASGLCCCAILGVCLARRAKLLSKLMSRKSESGSENLGQKADVVSVDTILESDQDDMTVIKRLSTIRPSMTRQTSQSRPSGEGEDVQAARTRVMWDLDLNKVSSKISSFFSSKKYSNHVTPESRIASKDAPRPAAAGPCCAPAEIDEEDLENPVALEPSWVSAGEPRMPIPVLSRSHRSQRSQHSQGTLLNAPCTPVNKSDTDKTLKRTIL